MKRRSFVKQSVSAAVLTPLAFSGLINAAGATEGGTDTGGTETTWSFETTGLVSSMLPDTSQCDVDLVSLNWFYLNNTCYAKANIAGALPDPDGNFPECLVFGLNCTLAGLGGLVFPPLGIATVSCAELRSGFTNPDGSDMLGPGYLDLFQCRMI